jgi:hypothetical protein
VILQRDLHVIGHLGGPFVVITPGIGARAAFAPGVLDDFGFHLHIGSRRGVDALLFGHGVGFERFELASGVVLVHRLEHDVVFELLADMCLQLESRHLQEADSLLQLRGHGQRLTQLQLQ